jgi:hypothetical protein
MMLIKPKLNSYVKLSKHDTSIYVKVIEVDNIEDDVFIGKYYSKINKTWEIKTFYPFFDRIDVETLDIDETMFLLFSQ